MKLHFYGIELTYNEAGEREYSVSHKEAEARETAKLYLPATKNDSFPCYLTRLPKDNVNTGSVADGYLILTKADDEAARAAWRQYYEKDADTFTRRAEECRKQADKCRKIAANL